MHQWCVWFTCIYIKVYQIRRSWVRIWVTPDKLLGSHLNELVWYPDKTDYKGTHIYLAARHPCLYIYLRFTFPLARWAPMQPAAISPTLDLCTKPPLWLGGPRQCRIRSFPDTSTLDQHWELNQEFLILNPMCTPYPRVPIPNIYILIDIIAIFLVQVGYNPDKGKTHPVFNPTSVWTHDFQIMTVHFMLLRRLH